MLDKNAIVELAKSFGRFIYFGVLGLVATFLTDLVSSGSLNDVKVTIGGMTISLTFVLVGAIAGIVKMIDRYRHVSEDIPSNGIAPSFLQGGK